MQKIVVDIETGTQTLVPLTPDEIEAVYVQRSTLTVDTTEIVANGVDTATVTVMSEADSVIVTITGAPPVEVEPAFDNMIEITADTPGIITVAVSGTSASLEITAE